MATLLRVYGEILECKRSGDWATVEEIARHIDLTPAKLVKVQQFPLSSPPYTLDLTYPTFSHTLGV